MFSISRLCGNFSRFCGNLRNQRFGFSRFCCKLIKWISVFYIYSDPYEGLFLEHGISNKGKLFIWKLVCLCNCINSFIHMFSISRLCGNFSRFCGNLRNQRFGFSRFCCKLIKWISVFYIYSDPYEGLFLEHGISNKGKLFIWKLVTVQFHMFILDALSHWNMESSV